MSQKFVVSHLDEQSSPLEENELKAKWVKGELLPIDYVYDESKQDWILIGERFAWATKAGGVTPPPLRETNPIKKKIETLAPTATLANAVALTVTKPVEISGSSVVKELKRPTGQGARVKLIDGMGEIDLAPLQPGEVELVLQDSSAGLLKLQNPLKIQVRPAEPFAIEWTVPAQQTCGQDIEVKVRALDKNGNLCSHYEDTFLLRASGPNGKEFGIEMKGGQASVRIPHTVAETWILSFHYSGTRVLKLPDDQPVDWQPGAATKLILDGPQEYIAGHPLKVQVKAVDAYGNLAKTFQGTVILEVKAS